MLRQSRKKESPRAGEYMYILRGGKSNGCMFAGSRERETRLTVVDTVGGKHPVDVWLEIDVLQSTCCDESTRK